MAIRLVELFLLTHEPLPKFSQRLDRRGLGGGMPSRPRFFAVTEIVNK